jgi:cbb3-type cytochrome oxidase subunit 1
MRGISFWFFFSATLYVLVGMIWGIIMAASGDHLLLSAHAHLNLVGWVTMALFGIYYHLVPASGAKKIAKIHFATATIGLFLMVPGIVLALQGKTEALAIIGSLLTLASMVVFSITVFRGRIISAK